MPNENIYYGKEDADKGDKRIEEALQDGERRARVSGFGHMLHAVGGSASKEDIERFRKEDEEKSKEMIAGLENHVRESLERPLRYRE